MSRRVILPAAFLAAVVFGQDIHLKTRTISTEERQRIRLNPQAVAADNPRHLIVQFDHPPDLEDVDSLAADATLVAALPDNAVVVTAPERRMLTRRDLRWVSPLAPSDKVSPAFDADADGAVSALVEFHGDVATARQEEVLAEAGIMWDRPSLLLPNHVLVRETLENLRRLAEQDEVAYVFPADDTLQLQPDVSACAGMLTASGPVAQYANVIHGWDVGPDHVARLSYVFGTVTPKVPVATVQAEIVRAMSEWSRIAGVAFSPGTVASAVRTILIRFVSGAHGDAYPFDGPGGTLAHTFYPVPVNPEPIAGDIHLDADEKWHAGGDVDIYSVALHELGHAIGLGHSDKPGDVMYPYYRRGMLLSAGDIGSAQKLYGPASGAAQPVTEAPAVEAMRLSIDPVGAQTTAGQTSLSGTLSGGEAPYSVQWQSDQAYAGKASVSASGAWTATGISLVMGSNSISVTGFDSAHRTASQTVVVSKTAAGPSSVPVSLKVTSPVGTVITTGQAALTVTGTAASGAGVSRVVWQTNAGASGTAVGTERWSAGGIPLLIGTNTVIVRVYDAKGGTAWASLVVVRR